MNTAIKHWRLPLAISTICIAIAFFGDAGRQALQYLGSGQSFQFQDLSYRWFTGHFTHIGWRHVGLNLLGLISVWTLYGRAIRPKLWLIFLLICPIGISFGFSLFSPQTAYYVGLSAVLHGMLAAAVTVTLLAPNPQVNSTSLLKHRWEELIVLAGLWGKVAYEQTVGAVPLTASLAGDAVVVNSHLYGTLIGTAFAAGLCLYKATDR